MFLIVLIVVVQVQAQESLTAIKAGKLVDPQTGTILMNQVILVEGSRIKAIGTNLPIPQGSTVLDLSNMTVMPGLFDCHTHLCYFSRKQSDSLPRREYMASLVSNSLFNTTAYRALRGVANAREMLEAGFTTVRDVGNAGNYADSDLRRSIEEGFISGPTIVNAGKIIAPYGGQDLLQPEKRELLSVDYIYADTRDELKKAIRENIQYGATVIKIVVDDQPYIYSADDIRFIVEEAGKAGLKVAAHCVTASGARNAAEAGVASIEHGDAMTDEILALAKKNNVVLVGTDWTETYALGVGSSPETHKALIDRLRRAHKVGVTMAFGSDVHAALPGFTRGTLAVSLIESSIEAGLPPQLILQTMTTNAARLLGIEKERGAIKVGLLADIIATPENPLDNVLTLKQVSFVMKNGRVVKLKR